MITLDVAVQVVLISSISGLLSAIIIKLMSRRFEKSEAASKEGDAAKALSEAARVQVETYGKEFVEPLKDRIDSLEEENKALRSLLLDSENRYDILRRSSNEQVESLQLQIKNLTVSVNSQRDQIVVLIEQGESKEKTIRRMQDQIDQLQRENEILKTEVAKLQSENDALRTQPIGE